MEFFGPLYILEKAESNRNRIDKAIKRTSKRFTGLKQSTSNTLIYELIGYNPANRFEIWRNESMEKWEQMKRYEAINITRKEEEPVKVMKWIPKRFVNYCNLINNECPKCELSRITVDHLKEVHGIRVPTPLEMINLIEEKWKPGITREKMMIQPLYLR